jgi:hypothetical protein
MGRLFCGYKINFNFLLTHLSNGVNICKQSLMTGRQHDVVEKHFLKKVLTIGRRTDILIELLLNEVFMK